MSGLEAAEALMLAAALVTVKKGSDANMQFVMASVRSEADPRLGRTHTVAQASQYSHYNNNEEGPCSLRS